MLPKPDDCLKFLKFLVNVLIKSKVWLSPRYEFQMLHSYIDVMPALNSEKLSTVHSLKVGSNLSQKFKVASILELFID